ncbi:MAG: sensor domain-containing protein [Nocardiopsaceae bacterium]|mgnify:CR=1 FL=1|nr:sensor domain-containing protein [Nocardiopsaceae bacterium]
MSELTRRIGADTRYLILGFPAAVVSFSLLVPLFATGLGTAVTVFGLFVLALALLIARGFATAERNLLSEVLGRPISAPRYRRPPVGAGWFRTGTTPLACGQSWMDLAYGILRLPLATASFTIAVSWWAVALGGLAYPLYGWVIEATPGNTSLPELLGLSDGLGVSFLFHVLVGALSAATLPFVLRFTALLNAGLAQALLTPAPSPGGIGAHQGVPPFGPATPPHAPSAPQSGSYFRRGVVTGPAP